MNMTTFKPFLLLISLLALALVSSCVPVRALSKGEIGETGRLQPTKSILYLAVKTGIVGTTSNVSITLGDNKTHALTTIPNLVDWDINSLNAPRHVYFQTGQLDVLAGPVNLDAFTSNACYMKITITGTGDIPDWYPDQIQIISNASVIGMYTFFFEQPISSANQYSVERNDCPRADKGIMTGCTKASLAI